MSPSRMPTRPPQRASASARFTATVVLPTPPLPAPTAMMFFTPGGGGLLAQLVLHRAGGRRQLDREGDVAVRDRQVLDEAERDDVPAQVGIVDDAQGVEHGVAVGGCGHW